MLRTSEMIYNRPIGQCLKVLLQGIDKSNKMIITLVYDYISCRLNFLFQKQIAAKINGNFFKMAAKRLTLGQKSIRSQITTFLLGVHCTKPNQNRPARS